MTYTLTLQPNEGSSFEEADRAYEICNEPMTLDEALAASRDLRMHGKLTDEAGFVVGWIHPDGTWRLK